MKIPASDPRAPRHPWLHLALIPLALACTNPLVAPAEEKPKLPYQTLGAPRVAKVQAEWNRFHDHAQATKIIQNLAAAYPDLTRLQSLGKSHGGREMWLLTVTNFAKGDANSRPAMWIDGGIHANEIQSVEVVLYTAWFLCEMADESDVVRRLLDERVFFLLPMMSPDSRDAHFYEPNTTHSPRTGQRPFDDDRDGLVDEDGPDDLDGDESITLMRVRDPNGRYKPHADFPQLLVPVKDGEKGEYSILGQEGKDSDGDGEVNEDGDGYYDPNRDWGWNWQPDYVQNGAHRYPFSIQENRLVADFIAAHPNIAGGQSYHNAGGMILRGPGDKADSFETADVKVYDSLAQRGSQVLPGYRYMNIANDLYEVWGGEVDWLHQSRGVFAFTNELFTPFNFFRQPGHQGFFGSPEVQHMFDKYLLLGEGFSPWKEIDHPQYGKVEVGGMKKNWIRQPPSFLLEEECHRNMAFTLYHADELPLIKIQSVEVKPLGGNLRQVTAILENPKICPTHSAGDVKRKITPPDIAALSGENAQVILGLVSSEPFFKEPAEQKREPARLKLASIPGRDVVYVRWLVAGEGPLEVTLSSVKGGSDRREVK
ncbi:MAG: M14 family metallopeptidase [Pirellulaceae bacterium]|nr:M14 family metallopeptidase [Pirellulaceae bacterium]